MRIQLSRHDRMLLRLGFLVASAVGAVVFSILLSGEEWRRIQTDSAATAELRADVNELVVAVRAQQTAVDEYLLSGDEHATEHFAEANETADALFAGLQVEGVALATLPARVAELESAVAAWQSAYARPAMQAVRDRGDIAPFAARAAGDDEIVVHAIEDLLGQVDDAEAAIAARNEDLSVFGAISTAVALVFLAIVAIFAVWIINRYGRALQRDTENASVLNRFTEVTSFAPDDVSVAASNLEALRLLAEPDAAVTHVLNRSKDRAVPEAVFGPAIAEVLPLNSLSRCAGVVRGSMYVSSDVSAPLSVRCATYPAEHGTVACIPLNSGEWVGTVHLYWDRPNALAFEARPTLVRVAEHAALAIGNRRLMAALHGQANTDPRTGLANSRAYDLAVEEALAARVNDEPLTVLMLDLDHFKDFNDRHGHPAGDEALRAFAEILRSSMREGDVAARYGGEEFAVLLPGVDADGGRAIAERIRARTETTLIALGPGITERITVSIGVASAPAQGLERVTLLRLADEALYRAKAAGRNRVEAPVAVHDTAA